METLEPPATSLGVALFVGGWLIGLTTLGIVVVMAWAIARQLRQRFWRAIACALTLLFCQTIANAIYVTHTVPTVAIVEWDWFLLAYYLPRLTTYLVFMWAFGGVLNDLYEREQQTAPEQTATAERLRQLEYLLPHLDRSARALLRKPDEDTSH